MLSLRRFLVSDALRSGDLADYLLSPFSGFSVEGAYSIDAQVRGNRLIDRESITASLREKSRLFEAMEDIATDRDADILLGELEDAVRSMVKRPEAWRREQLAAMASLRDVASAARLADLDMEGVVDLLAHSSVDASRSLDVGDDGRSRGNDLAAFPADVVFADYRHAMSFPSASCDIAVACDLTSAAFPASDSDDAATTLLAKLGIFPDDDALSRMRRLFTALLAAPRKTFLGRSLPQRRECRPDVPRRRPRGIHRLLSRGSVCSRRHQESLHVARLFAGGDCQARGGDPCRECRHGGR